MKKYLIKNELLDASLYLLVASDKECTKFLNSIDARAKGKDKWESDDDDSTYGNFYKINDTVDKNGPCRIISLKKFRGTLFDLGVLVHELQHYVNNVCLSKGIKHTRGDEETSAYLMEFMFKECLKALKYK